MPDTFFELSLADRREALEFASSKSGRGVHLLDKDVWVVWALQTLFDSSMGERLVLKGGTSLSKAHNVIDRFSEDVDLTYDIRALVPELGSETSWEPSSRNQAKRISKKVEQLLPQWIDGQVMPVLSRALEGLAVPAELRREDDDVFVEYKPLATNTGYMPPRVKLEFWERSTGEPCEPRSVSCDAQNHLPQVIFPSCGASRGCS